MDTEGALGTGCEGTLSGCDGGRADAGRAELPGLPRGRVTGYEPSGQQPQAKSSWSRTAGALLSQT